MAAVPIPVTLPTKTHTLLYAALTSFARTFLITLLSFSTGILAATNLSTALSLSLAALAASLAAAIRTVQVFFPQISFGTLIPQPWGAYADSAVRTFLAVFTMTAAGWLGAANLDWSTWHSALNAALLGAGAAVLRGVQGAVTPTEFPFVNKPAIAVNPAVPPTMPTTVTTAPPK